MDQGASSLGYASDLHHQRDVDLRGHGRSEVRRWLRAAPPRHVETYPIERYTLELKDGQYHIMAWQLGQSIAGEITTICP